MCLAIVLSIVRWYIHSRVRTHDFSAAEIHINSHRIFFKIGGILIMRMDDSDHFP